jgi:hypothetical protein
MTGIIVTISITSALKKNGAFFKYLSVVFNIDYLFTFKLKVNTKPSET